MIIRSTRELSTERFSLLIVGASGVGKTTTAKTLPSPHSEILLISAESGLACLYETDIPAIVIDPSNPFKRESKMDESNPTYPITEIFLKLTTQEFKKKYKYIFIDSLTEISQLILTDLKKDPEIMKSKNGYELWGKYKERMIMIIKMFRDLSPYTVIFTCLNDFDKDGVELVENFNIEGSSIRSSIKAMFDIVLKYEIIDIENKKYRKFITDPEINPLSKDRSSKLNKYEEPNLSSIMSKLIGV